MLCATGPLGILWQHLNHKVHQFHVHSYILNGIKVWVFSEKTLKKHLFRHNKNYYYFWKSNIPVINLIADSRIMIKASKNMSQPKLSVFSQLSAKYNS